MIQCDERFPSCVRCERSGFPCPGPKSRMIRFFKPGAKEEHINYRSEVPPGPTQTSSELLNLELVERLKQVKSVGYQLQQFGKLFDHLPSQIGTNAALDASVRTFLEAHRRALHDGSKLEAQRKDLYYYTQALAVLQQDIHNYRSDIPPGSVCAATILSLYEVGTLCNEKHFAKGVWLKDPVLFWQ